MSALGNFTEMNQQSQTPATAAAPAPQKRGRPKKDSQVTSEEAPAVKRPRGRPRKHPQPAIASSSTSGLDMILLSDPDDGDYEDGGDDRQDAGSNNHPSRAASARNRLRSRPGGQPQPAELISLSSSPSRQGQSENDGEEDEDGDDQHAGPSAAPPAAPVKRPRGRPRKYTGSPRPKKRTARTIARELARRELADVEPQRHIRPAMTTEQAEMGLPAAPVDSILWSDDDERRLQSSWTAQDEAILKRHTDSVTSERPFWKIILQMFGRHPHHLFRYGLKYDPRNSHVNVDGRRVHSPYLSDHMCLDLQAVLCHPIWAGDLAMVRYVLQMAVTYRVPGHIQPIGALALKEHESSLYELARRQDRDLALTCLATLYKTRYTERPEIQKLCSLLEKAVIKDLPADDDDDHDEDSLSVERTLFLLQDCDVAAVKTALDNLNLNGIVETYKSCEAFLEAFKDGMEGGRRGRFAPMETETLQKWKKTCVLADRRDRLIARKCWESEVGKDERASFTDIDPADGQPLHLECGELLGIRDAHIELLRGVVGPVMPEEPLTLTSEDRHEMGQDNHERVSEEPSEENELVDQLLGYLDREEV
ncbi:hypothetical protein VTK56DRAFT_7613 [Thermocarpiscus australiensis]